jgi:hypothetical protein
MTCSKLRFRRTDPSASLVAVISLVFLHDESQSADEELDYLACLKYILDNIVTCIIAYRQGMVWRMDLLDSYKP